LAAVDEPGGPAQPSIETSPGAASYCLERFRVGPRQKAAFLGDIRIHGDEDNTRCT
jgi:hypothetical protein